MRQGGNVFSSARVMRVNQLYYRFVIWLGFFAKRVVPLVGSNCLVGRSALEVCTREPGEISIVSEGVRMLPTIFIYPLRLKTSLFLASVYFHLFFSLSYTNAPERFHKVFPAYCIVIAHYACL